MSPLYVRKCACVCSVVRSYESEKEEESERSGGEGEEGGASRSNRAALPELQVSNSYYFTLASPPPPSPHPLPVALNRALWPRTTSKPGSNVRMVCMLNRLYSLRPLSRARVSLADRPRAGRALLGRVGQREP
jgi:hypothetical protein